MSRTSRSETRNTPEKAVSLYLQRADYYTHPERLASALAARGQEGLPALRDRLDGDSTGSLERRNLIEIAYRMEARRRYQVSADAELMEFLERHANAMPYSTFRHRAVIYVDEIRDMGASGRFLRPGVSTEQR